MTSSRKLSVFLCHASDDKPAVRHLRDKLHGDGFDVWLDEARLLPGQDWEREIKKALKAADTVIVCLSRLSIVKEGYVQKEVRRAIAIAEEKPPGTIFLIPVKLDACEVPLELEHLHWINLFEGDGYARTVQALTERSRQRGFLP
jgi:hypothetical protein